jgi:hypothetical protein
VAATTQGSIGDALATLETSRSLEALPSTAEALRHGELSFDQVREIASVAGARPEAEADLPAVADGNNLKSLKEACAPERARASSAAEENERSLKIERPVHVPLE